MLKGLKILVSKPILNWISIIIPILMVLRQKEPLLYLKVGQVKMEENIGVYCLQKIFIWNDK
ncbi:MAG: hypothetical protein DCC43_00505 [Candidatus Brocadia sp.]|nr:hypothetical protein [Candidatus Brocadia sp. AMX3]OQZ03148.1 MAG: hypothetical protein B6D35_00185 [Candidatus Brocadia sp. UTAMX2]RIK03308.1 MAG: hypothetical protein DCC43_00505 [Candidatus Brocadia sp.]